MNSAIVLITHIETNNVSTLKTLDCSKGIFGVEKTDDTRGSSTISTVDIYNKHTRLKYINYLKFGIFMRFRMFYGVLFFMVFCFLRF